MYVALVAENVVSSGTYPRSCFFLLGQLMVPGSRMARDASLAAGSDLKCWMAPAMRGDQTTIPIMPSASAKCWCTRLWGTVPVVTSMEGVSADASILASASGVSVSMKTYRDCDDCVSARRTDVRRGYGVDDVVCVPAELVLLRRPFGGSVDVVNPEAPMLTLALLEKAYFEFDGDLKSFPLTRHKCQEALDYVALGHEAAIAGSAWIA